MVNPERFLSDAEKKRIEEAVRAAESRTAAEVRVVVEGRCYGDPQSRAAHHFEDLRMAETAERSGVLFYLAVKDRRFAVIGDSGIHRRVPPEFWPAVARAMEDEFRAGRFAAGLERGIATVGERLASLFPRRADDRNELDDGIVER